MSEKPEQKQQPKDVAPPKEKGLDSGNANAAVVQDNNFNKVHQQAAKSDKPASLTREHEKQTGKAVESFRLTGDQDLNDNKKKAPATKSKPPLSPMTEQELVILSERDPMARSFLKEVERLKETKGAAAKAEIENAMLTATKTLAPELQHLRLEKNQHVPPLDSAQQADVEAAVKATLAYASVRFNPVSVANLKIEKDDIGSAMTVAILGPEVSALLGKKESQNFGKRLLLFGTAPMVGALQDAADELQKHPMDLVGEGARNALIGTGIGIALVFCPPPVTAIVLGAGVVALGYDQFFTKENQERNRQLAEINGKVDGMNNADLLHYTQTTSKILGDDVFKTIFGVATGGPTIPEGAVVAPMIGKKLGVFIEQHVSKEFLIAAQDMLKIAIERMEFLTGGLRRFKTVAEKEKLPPKGKPDEAWKEELRPYDDYKLPTDVFGRTHRKPPQAYLETMKNEEFRPKPEFVRDVFPKIRDGILKGELNFLNQHDVLILPVRRIEDLAHAGVKGITRTMKACYDPNSNTIYVAEKTYYDSLRGAAKSRDDLFGDIAPQAYNFDIHHEIAHAIDHLFQKEPLSKNFEFLVAFEKGNDTEAAKKFWSAFDPHLFPEEKRIEEVFCDMYAHVIADNLKPRINLEPGDYSTELRTIYKDAYAYMEKMVNKGQMKQILEKRR